MPAPGDHISDEHIAVFDELAGFTRDPDESLAGLRQLMQDPRLRVPPKVRSAVRQCDEAI